jgi:hypothetical protein
MVFYKVYMQENDAKEKELIGILPERRKTPERMTRESVVNWTRMVFGEPVSNNNGIFFRKATD